MINQLLRIVSFQLPVIHKNLKDKSPPLVIKFDEKNWNRKRVSIINNISLAYYNKIYRSENSKT